MSSIGSFLRRIPQRIGLPQPVTSDMLISDRNGITGQPLQGQPDDQGGLVTDQTQVPSAMAPGVDPSRLPMPKMRPSPPPQDMPPPQVQPESLPPQGPPPPVTPQRVQGQTQSLPFPQYGGPPPVTPDMLINSAAQNIQAPPPSPPSMTRRILGALTPTVIPGLQPLVEYGPKKMGEWEQYNRQQSMAPKQIQLANTAVDLQKEQGNAIDRQQRQQDLNQNREQQLDAKSQQLKLNQLKEQDDFANRDQGKWVPANSPIPAGYVQTPSAQYDTPGMIRIAPTAEQRAEMKNPTRAITSAMAEGLGKETGIEEGQRVPEETYRELLKMATAKIKDPSLHFVVGDNDVTGDQTITALDPLTGKVKSTVIVKGGAKKRAPGESNDHGQNFVDPMTNELQHVLPGQKVPKGALTASGVNTINTPTSQSRAMAEMAQTVVQQVPGLISQIDDLKAKIGPGAGRWNDLWVNRAGLNDPDFAGLDQDLDLFASAMVRTHFGARGGQGYREALKKDFTAAQSPEDLKSRIQHADTWLDGYAKMGAQTPASEAVTGARPTVGPVLVKTKAERDKLAAGTKYVDAQGNVATKQ